MDISQLSIADTADVEITLPSGEATDIVIQVYGQDSDAYKKVSRKQQNSRLKDMQRGKKGNTTAEDIEARGFDLLVSCVASWSGVESGGKALECTPDNIRLLFKQLPFIKEQVDVAIADRVNFMKS